MFPGATEEHLIDQAGLDTLRAMAAAGGYRLAGEPDRVVDGRGWIVEDPETGVGGPVPEQTYRDQFRRDPGPDTPQVRMVTWRCRVEPAGDG